MNTYFTSIATTLLANRHDLVSETASEPVSPDIKIFNFTFRNKHEVFEALEKLDQAKATGCDGISAKALKLAAPKIFRVCLTFLMTLRTARWKTNLDWTLDWTGLESGLDWTGLNFFLRGVIFFFFGGGAVLFFLVCKKIAFRHFFHTATRTCSRTH